MNFALVQASVIGAWRAEQKIINAIAVDVEPTANRCANEITAVSADKVMPVTGADGCIER